MGLVRKGVAIFYFVIIYSHCFKPVKLKEDIFEECW